MISLIKRMLPWLFTTALSLVLILSTRDGKTVAPKGKVTDIVTLGSYPVNSLLRISALWSENSRLRRELTENRVNDFRLRELEQENIRLRQLLEFSLHSGMNLTAAEVVGFTADEGIRGVIINRGFSGGIAQGQAVITPQGLIGRIYRAYEHSSTVQIIADPNLGVAAKLIKGSETGIIRLGSNSKLLLEGIPLSAETAIGDTVVTSGEGGVFPPGIQIGTVVKVSSASDGWLLYVEVKPLVDLRRIEEVFVLNTAYLNE